MGTECAFPGTRWGRSEPFRAVRLARRSLRRAFAAGYNGAHAMQTQVQQWGDTIALRIPQRFAEAAKLGAGSSVELTLRSGELIITPLPAKPHLAELLAAITETNRPEEADFGAAVGREEW